MVFLRPMAAWDLDFVREVRNHPDTVCFLHDDRCFTEAETRQWFKTVSPRWYIIEVDASSVGYIRTADWNECERSVQIGADIHPAHRRRGYAFEAHTQFIDQLQQDGYQTVSLNILVNNAASQALYAKLGFQPDGPGPVSYRSDGKKWESVRMVLQLAGVPS